MKLTNKEIAKLAHVHIKACFNEHIPLGWIYDGLSRVIGFQGGWNDVCSADILLSEELPEEWKQALEKVILDKLQIDEEQ